MKDSVVFRTAFVFSVLLLLVSPLLALNPPFVARSSALIPHNPAATVFGGSIDMKADGSFLIAWGLPEGDLVRRFDANGVPLTAEIPVGSDATAVLAREDGGFVVFYSHSIGPSTYSLFARVFDSAGNGGSELDLLTTSYLPPRVGQDAAGRFVVARVDWVDQNFVLWADRYDASLVKQGGSISVGSVDVSLQSWDLSVKSDGAFVFFWEDYTAEGFSTQGQKILSGQLFQRRFDALGQAAGPAEALPVSSPTESRSAASPEGKVVVAYQGPNNSLGAQLFDATGAVLANFPVWSQIGDVGVTPAPAFLAGGQMAVAFDGWLGDNLATTQLVRFDAGGNPVGGLFHFLEPDLNMDRVRPVVASAGDRLVVLWTVSPPSSGSQSSLRYQVFDATLFADGFESGDLTAWSVAP